MLKPHDVAKYHHIDRQIFKHTLCDYVSNDNEILKKKVEKKKGEKKEKHV